MENVEEVEPVGENAQVRTIPLSVAVEARDLLSENGALVDLHLEQNDVVENENCFMGEDVLKYLKPDCLGGESDSEDEGLETPMPFSKMAKAMEKLTSDGGVMKKVLVPSNKASPADGALVTCHFNAYLEFSDEPFDSSLLRNQPCIFRLNDGGVIQGFEIAVKSMCLDEKATFLVRSDYAYGTMGCPPRIPSDAPILYEIELLNFVDCDAPNGIQNCPREDLKDIDMKKVVAAAKAEHLVGNDHFKKNFIAHAIPRYKNAIRLLENCNIMTDEEEALANKYLIKVHLNLALCSLRQNKPVNAIHHCNRVLDIEKYNVKALFRKGQAKSMLHEYVSAQDYFTRALHVEPHNKDIRNELMVLKEKVKRSDQLEKSFCVRAIH